MYQEERIIGILQFLKDHRRISVEQICEKFNVSRDTARRDLVKLEDRKAIVRTRGGAILPSSHNQVKNYSHRLKTVSSEKQRIGKEAATMIHDGDRIILDTSTTVQACANHMGAIDCTVITNSIHQAESLSNKEHVNIQLLGGQLEKEHRFLYGTSVIERLKKFNVDKAFIGVVGISDKGLTIAHEEDGMVKRNMMEQASEVIVLADHTKFGTTEFFQFASLDDVDVIITDKALDYQYQKLMDDHHVQLIVTERFN
ncbi:DeoR/GlpR family DNA-binding transcription regulator [Halobacillus yeomjeoni]|uniref:DeoR/GlpR family DNA-binding transcription regulator n=1 Tax=Halobacillus yeomjeoni TaxID=311194 RepID=UPI001CD2C107|nr:DeoR/GlpR family DNA-binding transcription regulator [Halobacillus yeomjeoni]MCA0984866.1 DeoR/GlpR family DNA-binding transcription regulator [Halobacillus yeomjeoni]